MKIALIPAALLILSAVTLAAPLEKPLPPALGVPAPEIAAVTLDGKPVHLLELRGKPVVLEFGSATEPLFRARAKAVETLVKKYAGKVTFVFLYTQEAHAADSPQALDLNTDEGFSFSQPTKMDERIALAKQTAERLHIDPAQVAVDQWNNFSFKTYGSYPNMTFVIDAKGVLQAGYPWMDTSKLNAALAALAGGKEVPADVRGHIRQSLPNAEQIAAMSLDMTGSRGPQGIGVLLDHLTLTDAQKMALYPAVAQFFSDLREFRGIQQAKATAATATDAAAASAAAAGVTPEKMQTMLTNLQNSVRNLDAACKQNLPPADYEKIMDLVHSGPELKRLFNADLRTK